MRRPTASIGCLLALAGALACGDNTPPVRTPNRIAVTSGNGQSAVTGTALPATITFTVSDDQGPLAGIKVAFSLGDPTGALSAVHDTTNAQGVVTVTWRVGGHLGEQTLSASVTGVTTPATATATVSIGPPATITVVSDPNQFVVVGRAVSSLPMVKVADRFSNGIAGLTITFADLTGRSTVTGATQVSDADGKATVGSWVVPNVVGAYNLTAKAGNLGTVLAAFAIPATVTAVGGDHQSANAGTQIASAPSVIALDDGGHPLVGATVRFTVASGGGRLIGVETVQTGADGIASAPVWVLGITPGTNQLKAEVAGVMPVLFTATGVAAVPAQMAAVGATTGAGYLGNYVSLVPSVVVTDASGQPVAAATVSFTVQSGNGSLRRAVNVTDYQGNAHLGSWRLGPTDASQSVEATVTGATPLTFTVVATPPPASQYHIEIRFIGPAPTASQKAAFDSAAARWSRILLPELSDEVFTPDIDMSFCGGVPLNETIDELLIFAEISHIDGVGNVLGQAGVCYIRDTSLLPVVGLMQFDVDDVNQLQTQGQFDEVVLHEMGHVLGIGSLWADLNLLLGKGSGDPTFPGPSAGAAFLGAETVGTEYGGTIVPVENTGGSGTRDSHWRESVLGSELMTGFLNPGENPLSAITIASLRDEGYLADDTQADQFTFAAALRSLSGPTIRLVEAPWTAPVRTIRGGVVRRILFR